MKFSNWHLVLRAIQYMNTGTMQGKRVTAALQKKYSCSCEQYFLDIFSSSVCKNKVKWSQVNTELFLLSWKKKIHPIHTYRMHKNSLWSKCKELKEMFWTFSKIHLKSLGNTSMWSINHLFHDYSVKHYKMHVSHPPIFIWHHDLRPSCLPCSCLVWRRPLCLFFMSHAVCCFV